jgi:hypothetical protein|tara:strand:- start:612 stop:746 length:135 start_codon:yes stop_codon:yes gene_type:complete
MGLMENKVKIAIKDIRNDLITKGEDIESLSIFEMVSDMERLFFF